MNERFRCASCGAEMAGDSPPGLCEGCLAPIRVAGSTSDTTPRLHDTGSFSKLIEPVGPSEQTLPGDSDRTVAGSTERSFPAGHERAGNSQSVGPPVRSFGNYELIQEVARGGMGRVFRARHVALNRTVAIKMILAGQLASDSDVQRFHAEAEAVAHLDHPNIVPVYEIGEHEGQYFFSMGFVEGQSLAQRVATGPLPPREAATLVKTISEAVQYAHDRGIIHRDLKPQNVMLDTQGVPRITDFGLAKKVQGGGGLTATGEVLGTPSYMPPEQAAGRAEEIGPESDVYALGAMLYCLLTGRPPFQAATALETLRQVLETEPASPRHLNPGVHRDLETICLKCLEKDPQRRYGSALALARELGRFLEGEPISARSIGAPARLWRWGKRKPVVAVLSSSVAALILFVAIAGPLVAVRQADLRGQADNRRNEAEKASYQATTKALDATQSLAQAYLSQAQVLHNASQAGRQSSALSLLRQATALQNDSADLVSRLGRDPEHWRDRTARFWTQERSVLRSEAIRWLSEFSLHAVAAVRFSIPPGIPTFTALGAMRKTSMALSPDGQRAVFLHVVLRAGSAEVTEQVEVLDFGSGKIVGRFEIRKGPPDERPASLMFEADSETLLVARVAPGQDRGRLSLERRAVPTGTVLKSLTLESLNGTAKPSGALATLDFSPDGRFLLSVDRQLPGTPSGRATLWNVADGKPIREIPSDFHPEAFLPDSRQIIGASSDRVALLEILSGKVTMKWPLPPAFKTFHALFVSGSYNFDPLLVSRKCLVPSPDGKWLAVLSFEAHVGSNVRVDIFDMESGTNRGQVVLETDRSAILYPLPPLVAFDHEARLLAVLTRHQLAIASVPWGESLIVEDLPEARGARANANRMMGPARPIGNELLIDREGSRLVTAVSPYDVFSVAGFEPSLSVANETKYQTVRSWDLARARSHPQVRTHEAAVESVRFAPKGGTLISGGADRTIRAWNPDGSARWTVGDSGDGALYPASFMVSPGKTVDNGRFDPSGTVLIARQPQRLELWETATGRLLRSFPLPTIAAISNDYRLMAVREPDERGASVLRVSNTVVGESVETFDMPAVNRAEFSDDGRFIVAQGLEAGQSTLVVGDLRDKRVVARFPWNDWRLGAAGKVLIGATLVGDKPALRAIELATGRTIGETQDPRLNVAEIRMGRIWFAPDESRAVVPFKSTNDPQGPHQLAVWTFDNPQLVLINSPWVDSYAAKVFLSADGSRLVASGHRPHTGFEFGAEAEIWDVTGAPKRLMTTSAEKKPLIKFDDSRVAFNAAHGIVATLLGDIQGGVGNACVTWEVTSGRSILRQDGRHQSLLDANRATAAAGEFVVVTPDNRIHHVVSLATGKIQISIDAPLGEPFIGSDRKVVMAELIAPAGGKADHEPAVGVWSLSDGRLLSTLRNQSSLRTVSPDGKYVVTRTKIGPAALNVWEAVSGKLVRSVPLHYAPTPPQSFAAPITNARFSQDGNWLAFNVNDRYRILNVESGQVRALDRPGHRSAVSAMEVSADGELVASAGDDAAICLWEAQSGRFVAMLEEETSPISAIAFSPDGTRLAARTESGRTRLWSLSTSHEATRVVVVAESLWDLPPVPPPSAGITAGPVFLPDGRLVAFGNSDGSISLHSAANGQVAQTLKAQGSAPVSALAVRSDVPGLASAETQGIVQLWELPSGAPKARVRADSGEIRALTFKAGLLAVAGDGLSLWDIDRQERLLSLEGHSAPINALSISPDGNTLATASDDRTVKLWDLDGLRRQLAELQLGW